MVGDVGVSFFWGEGEEIVLWIMEIWIGFKRSFFLKKGVFLKKSLEKLVKRRWNMM